MADQPYTVIVNSSGVQPAGGSRPAPRAADANPRGFQRFVQMIRNMRYISSRRAAETDVEKDPRRSIEEECGFPESAQLTAWFYQAMYDRNPIAARAVEVLPRETWQSTPEVYEDDDPNTDTAFEKAWKDLGASLRGEPSSFRQEEGSPVWSYLRRADELCGIGSFGILLLGFDDITGKPGGKTLRDPVDSVLASYRRYVKGNDGGQRRGVYSDPAAGAMTLPTPEDEWAADHSTEPNDTGFAPGLTKGAPLGDDVLYPDTETYGQQGDDGTAGQPSARLMFMRVYSNALVYVSRWCTDLSSPRYAHPEQYSVTMNDPHLQQGGVGLPTSTVQVHWTRVIHVADDLTTSEVFGVPRMRTIVNNLLSIDKISGADPEAYWRVAFPGVTFETHPQLGGDVNVDMDEMRDLYEQWVNSADRSMVLRGFSMVDHSPQVPDPTPHIDKQLELICIRLAIPVRIFKGSERGELASTQDDDKWNDRLKSRQQTHVIPRLVVPFVDRLIRAGVLPRPTRGFKVRWPDITSSSAIQRAQYTLSVVQALAAYIGGDVDAMITPSDVYTKLLGWKAEDAEAALRAVVTVAKGDDL